MSARSNAAASRVPAAMVAPPAAPFDSIAAVSLVLVSPSTLIMFSDASTALLSAPRSNRRSTGASVVIQQNIVAMSGWIIPEPLAHAPTL